jgi:hypothetical protein
MGDAKNCAVRLANRAVSFFLHPVQNGKNGGKKPL